MGWTVYIKDNSEGQGLLRIITQEPNGTFTNIVESFEKTGLFAKESFMKKGKKIVKGNQKILRVLMQEARPPRKQTNQPKQVYTEDYNNIMHDIIYNKDDDEDDGDIEQTIKTRQKEEIDKRANQIQESRNKTRPPAKVPKEEKIESELYTMNDLQAEDDMNDYLNGLISKQGDD